MNKEELVKAIATLTKLSQKSVSEVLGATICAIETAVGFLTQQIIFPIYSEVVVIFKN